MLDAIHGKSEAAAFLDPNNPSRSTEQQIAGKMIFGGEVPDIIPPDRIRGKDVSADVLAAQTGPFRSFRDDSEIRRDVRGTLSDNGTLTLDRGDTRTEIFSPEGASADYAAWKEDREAKNLTSGSSFQRGTKVRNYNDLANEYLGEQAIKMKEGLSPDAELRDMSVEEGDFMFRDNSGKVRVVDNQTRRPERGETTADDLMFNIVKQSSFKPDERRVLVDLMKSHANKIGKYDIDSVMRSIMDEQGLVLTDDLRAVNYGRESEIPFVRPGKHFRRSFYW